MKEQEVIMRAMAKKITWAQAGEDHRIVRARDASMERTVGTLAAGTAPPRIHSVASANEFLRESYIAEFNQRFAVAPTQPGHAFLPIRGKNLDLIFALHRERIVDHDNTVFVGPCILQIEKTHWRATLAHSRVTVYGHLDGTWSVGYGPHLVRRYNREGVPLLLEPLNQRRPKAVETNSSRWQQTSRSG